MLVVIILLQSSQTGGMGAGVSGNAFNAAFGGQGADKLLVRITTVLAVLFMSLMGFIVCLPSITVWALFGSSIKTIIKNNYVKKIVEYFMALLLFLTSVYIIIY